MYHKGWDNSNPLLGRNALPIYEAAFFLSISASFSSV